MVLRPVGTVTRSSSCFGKSSPSYSSNCGPVVKTTSIFGSTCSPLTSTSYCPPQTTIIDNRPYFSSYWYPRPSPTVIVNRAPDSVIIEESKAYVSSQPSTTDKVIATALSLLFLGILAYNLTKVTEVCDRLQEDCLDLAGNMMSNCTPHFVETNCRTYGWFRY